MNKDSQSLSDKYAREAANTIDRKLRQGTLYDVDELESIIQHALNESSREMAKWLELAAHHGTCLGRFGYHKFNPDSTRTDKYTQGICYDCGEGWEYHKHHSENSPCTCGLDQLRSSLHHED